MTQYASPKQEQANQTGKSEKKGGASLGPFLCWAVVFADIGTSIYYVPGILYGTVGPLTGFFVFVTMIVFILLTLKYVEVTYRFPQGGGVVTVAARALNHWFGALGGMFILVDYFLTAAISCLSGMLYLSVIVKAIGPSPSSWVFPLPCGSPLGY
jgi:amino acid transporter